MLVVIDVGNSNTVVGAFDGERLVDHWRLETHAASTSDQIGILLRQFFAAREVDVRAVDSGIVSSVVPTLQPTVLEALRRYFGIEALVVGPGIRTQMPILSENPREVGADRIVNAVAAYHHYRQGLIVVDFGTATTFDAITPRGEYLGGAIAPGLQISAEALFGATSKLPRVELVRPAQALGRNTVASMQAGILFGYVGLVEELVGRLSDELPFEVRCVATGGLAELIAAEASCIDEVRPHLTLEGLRLLYERNA